MAAFTIGALLPLLTITFSPTSIRTWVTVFSVALALAVTGLTSAHLGRSPRLRPVVRTVSGASSRWGSPT